MQVTPKIGVKALGEGEGGLSFITVQGSAEILGILSYGAWVYYLGIFSSEFWSFFGTSIRHQSMFQIFGYRSYLSTDS